MKTMEDFLSNTASAVMKYWYLITIVVTTSSMAALRTIKVDGKIDWIEAFMCAIFAYSIWFILEWFNLPEGAGVMIGAFMGYRGTNKVSNWISKKFGFDDEDDKKDKEE